MDCRECGRDGASNSTWGLCDDCYTEQKNIADWCWKMKEDADANR